MAPPTKTSPSKTPPNKTPVGKTPLGALPHTPSAVALVLGELFEDKANALASPFAQWMTASKPFFAFAQQYQSKIRKKVRTCRDWEESYNLYCELRTAYLLLQEPKFAVAYEAQGKGQGRSADFAVFFRTNTEFHVEVTRVRAPQPDAHTGAALVEYAARRLTDVVCEKFGQFSATVPNVLWVWDASGMLLSLAVGDVLHTLKRRAEARDADLYARYGFEKPADVIRYYQRLSAVVVQPLPSSLSIPLSMPLSIAGPERPTVWWQNADAKQPLSPKIVTPLRALLAADDSLPFPSA